MACADEKQSGQSTGRQCHRRGFLLTELLVVIAIMSIILAIAAPALNLLSGDRSIESAQNQAAAALSVARADAIYNQIPTGVCFFFDPVQGRQAMVEVQQTAYPVADTYTGDPEWLDSVPTRDAQYVAKGIGIQLIQNAPAGASDRYLSCGVILFDGKGQLVSNAYAFSQYSSLGERWKLTSDMVAPSLPAVLGNSPYFSQVGLALFDHNAFLNNGGTDADVANDSPPNTDSASVTPAGEAAEELWLDQNGVTVMIDPASGGIV